MLKRLVVFLLCCCLMLSCSNAFAHDGQEEHDEDLWLVMFGNNQFPGFSSSKGHYTGLNEKQKRFYIIADSAAICIDQFSQNLTMRSKEDTVYQRLSENVHFPFTFDEVDLNITQSINNKNIVANTHRAYTHRGWNFTEYPNKPFWNQRKQVMLLSLDYVLSQTNTNMLSWAPWLSNAVYGKPVSDTQADAFCSLVYYVHILGDHEEGDKPSKLNAIIPLSATHDTTNPGIITEILKCLELLFPKQTSSFSYMTLSSELDGIAYKADSNYYSTGGINTDEKCALNQEYAKDVITVLSAYIPTLLRNEPAFYNAFYK